MLRFTSPVCCRFAGALLFSLAATLSVRADGQALAAKGDVPKEGKVFTAEVVTSVDDIVMKAPGEDGKAMELTGNRKDTFVTRLEGLPQGKVRRLLVSSKTEGELIMNGEKMPPPEERDMLLDAPLVGTRADGKWTFKLEKGEPYKMQVDAITRFGESFSKDQAVALYGDVARKPGDKWEAAPGFCTKDVFGTLPLEDDAQGKVALEFVEVKTIEGTPCAVLKITFDISMSEEKAKVQGTANFKGSGTIHRSLADRVNLAWQFKGDAKMAPPEGSPQQGGQATMKFTVTGKTTVTAAK